MLYFLTVGTPMEIKMLTELQKFDYLTILLTDKISTIDSWPEGAMSAL